MAAGHVSENGLLGNTGKYRPVTLKRILTEV